jgi:hypothetical protein
METPLQKRLKFQNQVAPYWAHLAGQKRQPHQEKETQNAMHKPSSFYIPHFEPGEVKIETETGPPKGNQTPPEVTQNSVEETHSLNKTPAEEVHISNGRYRKFGSVSTEIEFLRAARIQAIAEIKKSIFANSNGPCDAEAEESATPSVLESNARNMEGLMPNVFQEKSKECRIEVITIDSDEEEMSNNKSFPVKNSAGSYGKFVAENLLKMLKDKEQLKNGDCGTNMNNYKSREVAADVPSMSTLCKDRTHDQDSKVS